MEPNSNQTIPTSFWRRQFDHTPTYSQIIFDLVMGVALPIICLIFDPIIFKSASACNENSTVAFATFTYSLVALGTLALLRWFINGQDFGRKAAFYAGIFFAGAISAFVVGILILPFSVLGLLVCIGILGFTPFLTAFVYLRNGIRAWKTARLNEPSLSYRWMFTLALTAALMVYTIPGLFQQWAWTTTPQSVISTQPCYPTSQ